MEDLHKNDKDGCESKDAHKEHPLLTYSAFEKAIREVIYNSIPKEPPFIDDTSEFTLEELYALRDKGYSGGFQIGGMWTGIGGAIAYREALIKEIKSWEK